ncbi:MAG: peptidoglycan editing factor PgeF [Desulfosalsimonadaceae bacterium]
MQFRKKNKLLYLTFDILDAHPDVLHGVFTRQGGKSAGAFASLNVGANCGDDPSAVLHNRRAIAGCLENRAMFFLSQVHGTRIVACDDSPPAKGERISPPEADGAVCSRPGIMLVVQVADCQSVMLHDPVQKAVANIHAGWRGSVGNIIGNCIEAMKRRFGSDPADIVAGIGPSLGPCCAEFIHYKTEIPESFWKYRDAQNRFNFWQASHDQLAACGVAPGNIEWSNICTRCNTHLFYSYRQANTTGRFASVIGMR